MTPILTAESIERHGWGTTCPVLSAAQIERIAQGLEAPLARRGGVRDILAWPAVQELARSAPIRSVAAAILGADCFAVRTILFDKTPQSKRMISIRVHLDACGLENGPMRVLPGSHLFGRLPADAIARWREICEPAGPAVERGGLLAFRPLLLHASSAATVPSHRRVIHLELAAEQLPGELRWHRQV
jgi:hypothetical protein